MEERLGVAGVGGNRRPECRERRLGVAARRPDQAKLVVVARAPGLECQGALDMRPRLGGPALGAEGARQIGVSIGVIGVEGNRALEMQAARQRVVARHQHGPQIVVGGRVHRREGDGAIEAGDGGGALAETMQRHRPVAMKLTLAAFGRDRPVDQRQRRGELAPLQDQGTQQMQGVGMGRLFGDRQAITRPGLSQPAGIVVGARFGEQAINCQGGGHGGDGSRRRCALIANYPATGRQANFGNSGESGELFTDPDHVAIPDNRRAYGEERFVVLGKNLGGRVCVLVITPRGERVRVISLSPANARERRFYEQGKDDKGRGA